MVNRIKEWEDEFHLSDKNEFDEDCDNQTPIPAPMTRNKDKEELPNISLMTKIKPSEEEKEESLNDSVEETAKIGNIIV
jgi:hypothetical protein